MGKRELIIVIAFVVVGAVAYQLTAPDPKPGERSFSFSRIFSNIRNEIREHSSKASVELAGTIAVESGIKELRVSTPRNVPLTVIGEQRKDVGYELPVESTGPDPEAAKSYAERVTLREDPLGPVLSLTLTFPEEGTQTAKLTLRVPNDLLVRIENAGRINVSEVAALELRNTAGETNVSGVAGAVRGSHRTGDLTIAGAQSVDLSLATTRAKFRGIKGGLTLNLRSGECWIGESSGPIDATLASVEFTVVGHAGGGTKIGAEGGRIKVTAPAGAVSIDARRALVELEIADQASDTTVLTTDEPIRLTLGEQAALVLDALTTEGDIKVSDVPVAPAKDGRQVKAGATIGAGGARVVLRNARGDIVISRRK
jgi:hypothetical protein